MFSFTSFSFNDSILFLGYKFLLDHDVFETEPSLLNKYWSLFFPILLVLNKIYLYP